MRPEASAFLGKAREFLLKAEDMFADGWPDEAGRAAYLAGLHAAQAVIVAPPCRSRSPARSTQRTRRCGNYLSRDCAGKSSPISRRKRPRRQRPRKALMTITS